MGKNGTQQIAALPWRKNKHGQIEILLITSRETKRWVIPKGWPITGLQNYNAARQEALEEAGVKGRMRKAPLGRFSYDKRKKSGVVTLLHVDVYAMQVGQTLATWPECHERKRQWFSLSEAENNLGEAELKQLVRAFPF